MSTEIDELEKRVASLEKEFRAHLAAALEEIAKRDAEIVGHRDEIALLHAKLSDTEEEIARLRAEAGRVVVPERAAWLTIDEMSDVVLEKCGIPKDYANEIAKAIADASIAKGAHSVPSSRILKDGEVAVDAEEWEAMCDLGFDPEPCRLDHNGCCQEHNWFSEKPCPTAILQRLYVLRTQATKGAGDDS